MMPLDYVLAVAILTAPGAPGRTVDNQHEGEAWLAELAPAIRDVALQWEVMDPREVGSLIAQPEHFDNDLRILRRRYQDLAEAPPLSDCLRFPMLGLANDLLEFNRAYRTHLVRRHAVEGRILDDLAHAIRERDDLYRVWDAVRDARSECYYVTVRRHALLSLRETLGYQAYYSGQLPPHVPLWRFSRLD